MLEASYIVLSLIMIGLSIFAIGRAFQDDKPKRSRMILRFALASIAWFVYLTAISVSEVLQDLSLPPKFPLFIFLPLIALSIWFYRDTRNNSWINKIPQSWPIYFQTFRIFVEIIILYTFKERILPKSATFEGYNFDVVIGLTAPVVAYYLFKSQQRKTIKVVYNILGILMILFVAGIIVTSMYFPSVWNSTETLVDMRFTEMPYLLLAGFLAPLGIFMHIFSLKQLKLVD